MHSTPLHNYIDTVNGVEFEMIYVEGDEFMMGGKFITGGYYNLFQEPNHKVKLSCFFIGKYPVTQTLWKGVTKTENTPFSFQGDDRPVESVNWHEAKSFIQKLNEIPTIKKRNEQDGMFYRLPSEAQWEYAARGGKQSKGYSYAGGNKLKEVGWYDLKSHEETKPVGMKIQNELGIYDMSGNVGEWCEDVFHLDYLGAPKDGNAWTSEGEQESRVIRGGSWSSPNNYCRSANRDQRDADDRVSFIGFRLIRF